MRDSVAVMIYGLPAQMRVVVVLTGAILIHLTIGTYHTFGNMLPYMASYMRNYTDPSIRIEHLMWIPTFQGCFPFAMVIGGFISLSIGPRATTFIGCLLATLGVALSSYTIQYSYWMFFLTYGLLFGLGQGIAYVTAVSAVINWAPDKVGLVSGMVAAGFGVSSSIFAPIQTELVNPDNLPATKDGYFLQKELLLRVPDVFLTLASIYAVMQIIGLIVICDPPEKIHATGRLSAGTVLGELRQFCGRGGGATPARFSAVSYKPLRTQEEEVTVDASLDGATRRRSASRDSRSSEEDSDEISDDLVPIAAHRDKSLRPSEMLQSSTFYFLFAALFCCSFYANMFYNMYKTFAETFIEDDFFLAMSFSLGSVLNAIARIAWGHLTDKTSFQTSVSTATCCAAALLLTMPITQRLGAMAYLVWLCGTFICMGATHALFITAIVRCFGSKYKATNYGFLTFSTTLSGVLLSVISQYYLEAIGYSYLFMITAVFPFCAFLITACIQVTPQGSLITG